MYQNVNNFTSAVRLCLKALLFLFTATFLQTAAFAQHTVSGTVFDDLNGNGQLDAGEEGVEGVMVSNGREITVTDRNGNYQLDTEDNSYIFVIKPRGWATPVGEHNIPQFYTLISSEGAGADNFRGLNPGMPEDLNSVNFPLSPQEEPDDFRVLVFGDTQPRNLEELNYLMNDTVQEVIGFDAAFGTTLGDLVFDDLDLFEPLNELIGNIGLPWRHIIGNHDIDFSADNNWDARGAYFRNYGPSYYAFSWGSAHFIAVDNIRWIVKEDERYYRLGYGEQQMEFITNYLDQIGEDELVFFLSHIPLVESTAWEDDAERVQFYELLSGYPNAVTFSAHTHRHYHRYITAEDGWPGGESEYHHSISMGTVNGSWWAGYPDAYGIPHSLMRDGTPIGYGLLDINGKDWKLTYKVSRRLADFQMHIHAENEVPVDRLRNTEVYANVFNALPGAKVEFRIGKSGEWKVMEVATERDPLYMAMHDRELALGGDAPFRQSGMGNPDPKHLWKATISEDLEPGTYTIYVRAEDEWANFEGRRMIRITE